MTYSKNAKILNKYFNEYGDEEKFIWTMSNEDIDQMNCLGAFITKSFRECSLFMYGGGLNPHSIPQKSPPPPNMGETFVAPPDQMWNLCDPPPPAYIYF